ncbi:glycosyltransferase family 2 protein [Cutibacterium sp. WCA-380-WT-3A]|uniref:Glycosyltransferase family 2 protein n=1 Tax=Cutibacterium porci TaxID=2605781 RepID=A0A7K0J4J3_9ACTN|nr:glycosyltransferase family A protein [Cutibacterium porci]MSS44854.1 glycosyltransferase family 2 protein [Cutibacterium porci]
MTTASIIIPSYRGATRLPRLLSALAAQTTDDWEAIVVVDGDVDGSEHVISKYSHLPIRTVVFPENRGRVAALNAGHEAARGDVLIRCDDDLEPAPDFVANHVASHSSRRQGTIGLCVNVLPRTRYSAVYGDHFGKLARNHAYRANPDGTWRYWAANVSVTRDIWQQIGTYDPHYRAYGWEDVDYGWRLHKAGIPVVIDPSLETKHHAAAVTAAIRAARAFRSGQARRIFDSLHGTNAAGPAAPEAVGLWNNAVLKTSLVLDYRRTIAMARAVDAIIHITPTPIARKLIALVVEAAVVAGHRSPENPERDF